jgi:hypothetical protein
MVALCVAAVGCDRFFTIEAVVRDCTRRTPLAGVRARLVLNRGYGEPDVVASTDAQGRIRLFMNEPPSSAATLTLSKTGYRELAQRFDAAPRQPVEICLDPTDPAPTSADRPVPAPP